MPTAAPWRAPPPRGAKVANDLSSARVAASPPRSPPAMRRLSSMANYNTGPLRRSTHRLCVARQQRCSVTRRTNRGTIRWMCMRPGRPSCSRPHRPRPEARTAAGGGRAAHRCGARTAAGCAGCDARSRHVPPAGAALARRRRTGSCDLHPMRGSDRRRRCVGGVVHEPGFRLLDVGGLSRTRRRARSVRRRTRRARLGHGSWREGDSRRRRLAHHRQLGIRQRQPPCHMARRTLSVLRGRWHDAAALPRWQAMGTHHAVPARGRHHQGCLASGRTARHRQRHVFGAGPVRR